MQQGMDKNFNTMISGFDIHWILRCGTKEMIWKIPQHVIDSNCVDEIGNTVLHAVFRNKTLMGKDIIEILTLLLTHFKIDPNIKNELEQTVLHLAVERRMVNAVNLLLKFGADIDSASELGNTIAHFFIEDELRKSTEAARNPLMNTPENRNIAEKCAVNFLEFLISKGVDFEYQNIQGDSAIYLAIKYCVAHVLPTLFLKAKNKSGLFQLLLDGNSGCNENPNPIYNPKYLTEAINMLFETGASIVDYEQLNYKIIKKAIRENRRMIVIEGLTSYYLSKCNNIDFATTLYQELMSTCLHWSSSHTDYFLTVFYDLIFKGVNVKNKSKQHVLNAIKAKNLHILEFLKANGVEFNFQFEDGKSLLHVLAEQVDCDGSNSDFYEKFSCLRICDDLQVNACNNSVKSALHTAISRCNVSMIQILIEFGADVNFKDMNMCTPLHEAMIANVPFGSIELLVTSGADVNVENSVGETPLHLAVYKNNLAAVQLLIQYGAFTVTMDKYQRTPLHRINWKIGEAVEMINLLVSHGSNVNTANLKGETPLHLAILSNNAFSVRSLIDHNADVNCKDENQQTPLHYGAKNNVCLAIFELLLRAGADVNSKDSEGNIPLYLIVKNSCSTYISQMLLEKGAYVNVWNNVGESPLYGALSSGKYLLVEQLLKYNANLMDSKIRQLLPQIREYPGIDELLTKYWIKVSIADFPLNDDYKMVKLRTNKEDVAFRNRCSTEISRLKNVFLEGNLSLYHFLHMRPEKRCAFVNSQKLKKAIQLPRRRVKFPEYEDIIMSSYREARVAGKRNKVMKVIAKVFLKIYGISVEGVARKIVNYLKDEDFCVFVSHEL